MTHSCYERLLIYYSLFLDYNLFYKYAMIYKVNSASNKNLYSRNKLNLVGRRFVS